MRSYRDIDPGVWSHAFRAQCKDSRFYEIVEETLRDKFEHRYLVLNNRDTGEAIVQPFFFVDQDIVAGSPRPVRMLVGRLRKRFPRLLVLRMLMSAAQPVRDILLATSLGLSSLARSAWFRRKTIESFHHPAEGLPGALPGGARSVFK